MSEFSNAARTLRNRIDTEVMAKLVDASSGATDSEIALLAEILAESGERLEPRERSADIPSTGGPSSLSTLLCPLLLRAQGQVVPKIGVEGRPAGAIDTLSTIPGYRTELGRPEMERILDSSGYVHLLAADFAPLDATLFAFRKRVGAVNQPQLATASLLSKKLAVGVRHMVLDVRVAPHGNFGSTLQEARANAKRFVRVAGMVGVRAACYLTDASQPYQPYIGRGESLLALDAILAHEHTGWLAEHVQQCIDMSEHSVLDRRDDYQWPLLKEVFARNLRDQGSSPAAFDARVSTVRNAPQTLVASSDFGYLAVDLRRLREVLVEANTAPGSAGFGDRIGLTLSHRGGTLVAAGDTVARIRGDPNSATTQAIGEAFSAVPQPRQTFVSEIIS